MKNKKTLLVGHVTEIVGPGNHLMNFLIKIPNRDTFVVFHPMIGSGLRESIVTLYSTANSERLVRKHKKANGFITQLAKDYLITFYEIVRIRGKIDCYIGLNNFDTLPALLFKGWKIKKIIYYGSDFADRRFENYFLNMCYKIIEICDLKMSNLIVSNTKRAEKRRLELGLSKNKSIVIPNGVEMKMIPNVIRKPIYDFVYLGYLSETHGVMDLVEAFTRLIDDDSSLKLALVGYGPIEEKVKDIVRKKDLSKSVFFMGRLSHKEALRFIKQKCKVGIASYNNSEGWTKYASPLKVKEYLACGLPVIISNVPEICDDIRTERLGLVYSNEVELLKSMQKLAQNPDLVDRLSENTVRYIKQYDWNTMFKKYLESHIA